MSKMFNPPHPGRMLSETLQYRGLSAEAFADMIGIDPHSLADILCEKLPFTPKMAERISAVIAGPSPEIWLDIQRDYDLNFPKNLHSNTGTGDYFPKKVISS